MGPSILLGNAFPKHIGTDSSTHLDVYKRQDRNIALVIQLVDMRHKPTADDLQMVDFLLQTGRPFIVVCTKSDKLNRTETEQQTGLFDELFRSQGISWLPFSAVKGVGLEDVKQAIENLSLIHILGAGQFIPGFEDQVVGHSIGDEFDVNVTFPEDYHAEELKGKPAVFKIKLHEIKVKELPTVDDEFVKDVSEFDTLDEYKKDIEKRLQEQREKAADSDVENQLVEAIIEKVQAEIPDEMVENEVDEIINSFAYRLQSQGLKLETYLKYTGQTLSLIHSYICIRDRIYSMWI